MAAPPPTDGDVGRRPRQRRNIQWPRCRRSGAATDGSVGGVVAAVVAAVAVAGDVKGASGDGDVGGDDYRRRQSCRRDPLTVRKRDNRRQFRCN